MVIFFYTKGQLSDCMKCCPYLSPTEMSDNSVQLRKDLKMFLYDLRIDAEVFVEEMVCVSTISVVYPQINTIQ